MTNGDKLGFRRSSLEAQLSELNSRGRWYTTETWQLPIAFIAATGFLIGQAANQPELLQLTLFAVGGAGILVWWHLMMVHDGIRRAVENIRVAEEELELRPTAEWHPSNSASMIALHFAYTVAAFVGALSCL